MRWLVFGLLSLVGCEQGGGRMTTPSDGGLPDQGPQAARLHVRVTNSVALMAPPQQAVYLWPMWGGMMPVTYGATPVAAVGDNFPAEFTVDLSAPPPADVLAFFASINRHSVFTNVSVVRMGSLVSSGSGEPSVAACDVWGMASQILVYFTEAGAWLPEAGFPSNTESYAQGYHLFVQHTIDAGTCMQPMCPGPTSALDEIALDTELVIDLVSPDTWCR